ncbi:MAG TPA: hypothetical protein PLW32_12485 [Chitinophagaceae bacterium]|jgi:hypothetical protein|nr:hypothetical protein [Chitinophagaceae bacterium]
MATLIKKYSLIYLLIVIGFSCKSQDNNYESFTYNSFIVDLETSETKRMLSQSDYKIWIKNNTMILENKICHHLTDIAGNSTAWDEVSRYTLINLGNISFYEYKTLTDTAKLLTSYTIPNDSNYVLFFKPYKDPLSPPFTWDIIKKGKYIADTSLGNDYYKRYRFSLKSESGDNVIYTLYLNPKLNKKVTFFKSLSKELGESIFRYDEYVENSGYLVFCELKTVSNSLNDGIIKVFNTWEKYSILNPVSLKK